MRIRIYKPCNFVAEVLAKMHAPPKDESIPIADPHELPNYDGVILGIPTRFGSAAAQIKAFWDATGSHWYSGKLVGKPGGVFFGSVLQGGGQETTALTWLTQFTAQGMIYIPMGNTYPAMFTNEEVHGGSPYGPGTITVSKHS